MPKGFDQYDKNGRQKVVEEDSIWNSSEPQKFMGIFDSLINSKRSGLV